MQSVKPRCAGRDNLGSAWWLALARSSRYYITDDGTKKLFTILCLLPTTNTHFRVIGTLPTAILFPPLLKSFETSSKMSLKKGIFFLKNAFFKGHLIRCRYIFKLILIQYAICIRFSLRKWVSIID